MTTKAMADWLTTAVETALTVTAYKGFPAWGRPTVSAPCAAVLFENYNPAAGTVGRNVAQKTTTFLVVVYTDNEVQLWSYLDTLQDYWIANGSATISSSLVRVRPETADRVTGDDLPEQARYAFQQRVTLMFK